MPRDASGRRRAPWWRVAIAAAAALAGGCVQNPQAAREAAFAQDIVNLGDAVTSLQQENASLQTQLDSLQRVVARQDTLLRQLAGMAGMPVPP